MGCLRRLPCMWKCAYDRDVTLIETIATAGHPGDTIRERRIELGWTQAELAKASGVTQADVSRIENGRLDARWSTIQRLSATLVVQRRPKRSLANGGRRNPPQARPATWEPRGAVAAIED
jgi:DNA-binding XRE family transcriptional regulator